MTCTNHHRVPGLQERHAVPTEPEGTSAAFEPQPLLRQLDLHIYLFASGVPTPRKFFRKILIHCFCTVFTRNGNRTSKIF